MNKAKFLISACMLSLFTAPAFGQDIEIAPLEEPYIDSVLKQARELDQNTQETDETNTIILNDDANEEENAMQSFPRVQLQALDKITARTVRFQVDIGQTVKFGDIYIRPQTCQEPPPIEDPESAAFMQIWEKANETESKWIYSGWMFASSPALASMDHPVYDVWVLDCLDISDKDDADTKKAAEE